MTYYRIYSQISGAKDKKSIIFITASTLETFKHTGKRLALEKGEGMIKWYVTVFKVAYLRLSDLISN